MDDVCDECGDVGYSHLLLRCINCNNAARHRYCLDEINFDSAVEWSCSDCIPKHNEAIKPPGDANCQRQLRNTKLDFSVVNEPNVEQEKVTKARVLRRNRPCREREASFDESIEHVPGGDTSNRGRCVEEPLDSREISVRDIPNLIDCKKEGEDINGHLICTPESFDGSSNLALDHASSIEPNNLQKAVGGSKLASDSMDWPDLPNARSGCFASLKYVEGFVPPGRKGDIFSLMNEVEGSRPIIVDKSCSTSASMEQADGLLVKIEKSEPLKLVKGLEETVVASKFAPNHSKPMQGSDLETGSVDVLNPLEQRLDSWAMPLMQSSPSNEPEDAATQENGAERTRCLVDMETVASELENHKESNPKMANESLSCGEGNSDEANRRSDELLSSTKDNKMRRRMCVARKIVNSCKVNGITDPEPAHGNRDAIKLQCNAGKTSLAVKKVPLQLILQEEGINNELLQEEGISNELLQEEGISNELLQEEGISNELLQDEGISNELLQEEGISNELLQEEGISNELLQEEGTNNELLPSKFVGPCESTKINPRKRKQSGNYAPDGTKYQKACIISGNENANVAWSKSGRPARTCQNTPRKDNGSSDNVIGHSKMGKDKKIVKSWLANKGIRYSRKRGMVTGVLQPYSLRRRSVDRSRPSRKRGMVTSVLQPYSLRRRSVDRSRPSQESGVVTSVLQPYSLRRRSVDRSRPSQERGMVTSVLQPYSLRRRYVDRSKPSENMDLALMESSCALNNPSSSCAAQASGFSSKSKELHERDEPKKRRKLILSYDEEEDAVALQAEDLNSWSCDDDEHVKKQRKCVENAAENQRRSIEEGKEALGSGNLNRCSKNHKQVKKQRSIEAEEDENASVRNLNAGCSRMPVISECIGGQPLDIPCWTGIMKINNNYIPLAAHLSTKAGKKVQELSRSLPPIMKVAKFSTSKSCPHFEAPIPTADSIGLYFFSGDMRQTKELDELVKHLADSGIVLEAVVGLRKLFLFPSGALPVQHQTFQGKPYLWGMFKPRKGKIRRLPPVEQDCTAHVSKEEHAQEQHSLDQEDKAQSNTLDLVVHPENQPLLDANQLGKEALSGNVLPPVDVGALVSANIGPADHGQRCSNPEAPPPKLCGFVVSRTPRSAQLIQEMQKEGALLFAVQQVMTEPGSVV
ncbi:uncharacterized protein LOC119295422 isoform X1 [Triticum dicoccoides]|uniref:uncharacterized protein LOC119295422 isoform X1 n=1 Tax=Triticum dicoccoides TaxID=85692 RepID=UPI00188F1861|nr:uncharacterized protein LOC119295422 isoform X1 [Triticum dicoccoides]